MGMTINEGSIETTKPKPYSGTQGVREAAANGDRESQLELARSYFKPEVVRYATDDELIRLWELRHLVDVSDAKRVIAEIDDRRFSDRLTANLEQAARDEGVTLTPITVDDTSELAQAFREGHACLVSNTVGGGTRTQQIRTHPFSRSPLDVAASPESHPQVTGYLASETAEFVASIDRVFAQLGELKRRALDRTLAPSETLAACRVACGLMDDCARYADAVHHIAFHDTVAESLDDTLSQAKHEGRPSTSSNTSKHATPSTTDQDQDPNDDHDNPAGDEPAASASLSPPAAEASTGASAASGAEAPTTEPAHD